MERVSVLTGHLVPTEHRGDDEALRRVHRPVLTSDTAGAESDEEEKEDEKESEDMQKELELKVERNSTTKEWELAPLAARLSFDQGFFYTIRAIELFHEKQPDKIICVGIGGPPGAGKSTLAAKLNETLDSLTIPLHQFIKVDGVRDNSEDPELVQFDKVQEAIQRLKRGEVAEVPTVNHAQKSVGSTQVSLPSSRILCVEGSYALHSSLASLFDITISLDGGIHFNLLQKIMKDIYSTKFSQKEQLSQVTNVLFPMFKVFTESMDSVLRNAKIRIHSLYNPMTSMLEPTYVIKAKYADVSEGFESAVRQIVPDYKPGTAADRKVYSAGDRRNTKEAIRVRRIDGLFQIFFYNELTDKTVNVRPVINFEISVKTISGLLSLGYQLGVILNRTQEMLFEKNGVQVTRDTIKELEQEYIQVKGKNRNEVLSLSKKLNLAQHHIPTSFLEIYNQNLRRRVAAKNAAVTNGAKKATV